MRCAEDKTDMTPFSIAGKHFDSRLLLGTGKFGSPDIMRAAIEASETQIVTVALGRVDLAKPRENIVSFIDRSKITLLPNTAGSRTAKEAVTMARLAREAGLGNWVKLEVVPEPRYLFPDPVETLLAAKELVEDDFVVLPYMNADPILALRLADVGCATVMPLGSPIGSAQGIKTKDAIAIIIEQARVPVIIDAGLGKPSHAAEAMEMGAHAVLVNTAIATAKDPVVMAACFRDAVRVGAKAHHAGCAPEYDHARATSPSWHL